MAQHHQASSKKAQTSFTYPDAVHAFNDPNVQVDLAQACEKLAKATASLLSKFDAIATQLHKFDAQDKSNPSGLRQRWNGMHRVRRSLPRSLSARGLV